MRSTALLFCTILLLSLQAFPSLKAQSGIEMATHYLERAEDLYNQSKYDSLLFYYSQARKIYLKEGYTEVVAECILGLSEYYRMINNLSQAKVYLDTAQLLIETEIGLETEAWSDALFVQAKLLYSQNQLDEALRKIEDCIELRVRIKTSDEKIADARKVQGFVYFYKGDYPNAEKCYLQANEFFKESEGTTVDKALIQLYLGMVYGKMEAMGEWYRSITLAIENFRALGGDYNADLAKCYSSLASYYILSGRTDSATIHLDRSEELYMGIFGIDYSERDEIYTNRARILQLEGNYYSGIDYYREVERIQTENRQRDDFGSYIRYGNTAHLYRLLKDYDTAQYYYDKLLGAEGLVDSTRMIFYYEYNAINQTSLGNFQLAKAYFDKVFQGLETHYPDNQYIKTTGLYRYGELLDSLGKFNEASQYFMNALNIIIENFSTSHPLTAQYLKHAGDHFFRMGDVSMALEYYQQSLQSLYPGYDVGDPGTNPPASTIQDRLFFLGLLKQKAACLEMLSRTDDSDEYLDAAFHAYRLSVQLTESLRTYYLNDQSKLYLSENERVTYENLIRSAFELYEKSGDLFYLNEAFIAAEKSKYATLVSVLQRSDAIDLAGIPDSIKDMESTWQKQLSVNRELLLETLSDTLLNSTRQQRIQSEVLTLNNWIAQLNRDLETTYPEYYNLLYNPQVTDIRSAKKCLNWNEKLVEYFMTSDYLYIFEISRRVSVFHRIPLDQTFVEDLQIADRFLKTSILNADPEWSEFLPAANRLYNALVPGGGDTRNLLIIPEGPLAFIPFDILLTEPVKDSNLIISKLPFLIRDHSVRYTYSVTLLNSGGNYKHRKTGNLVAFAPVYEGPSLSMSRPESQRELHIDRSTLEPLPGTLLEVEEVGIMTGGKSITGLYASESRFKIETPGNDILHLAMHAFLDDEDPLQSKLVFSADTADGQDGFLNVYEIYNLDLTARMVVLSACNTGSGLLKGGEGIMSLARAFMYTGVHNIVMTFWTVSDARSSELMQGFYRYLLKGKSISMALRKAKLDMLNSEEPIYQLPQYWAGYISVGSDEVIFQGKIYIRILAGILITAFITFILLRRRIRKKARM